MENLQNGKVELNNKYCKRCHRKLKDEQSKKLGYGKVCYKKVNLYKDIYLFEIKE